MHELKVEVKFHRQAIENDDPGTACRNNQDPLNNEFNCKSQCRLDLIQEICSCTPWSISYLATDEELPIYPLCDYESCNAR
jgi:hypothetical protein